MAGGGWRQWVRERLPADVLQSYLQDQVVTVWASRAARSATLTAPSAGMFSYLIDEQAFEVYRDGAWHQVRQQIVAYFQQAAASSQIATTSFTRVTSGLGGSCNLRAGFAYRASWHASFTTQTAGQGAVAAISLGNVGATPATSDPQIAQFGYVVPTSDQPVNTPLSGVFQVATSKAYTFSQWLRRASIAPGTGYVQANPMVNAAGAAQWLTVENLGTIAELYANMTAGSGVVPTIAI